MTVVHVPPPILSSLRFRTLFSYIMNSPTGWPSPASASTFTVIALSALISLTNSLRRAAVRMPGTNGSIGLGGDGIFRFGLRALQKGESLRRWTRLLLLPDAGLPAGYLRA